MESDSGESNSSQNAGIHILITVMDSVAEAVRYQALVNTFQVTTVDPVVLQTIYRAKKREESSAFTAKDS